MKIEQVINFQKEIINIRRIDIDANKSTMEYYFNKIKVAILDGKKYAKLNIDSLNELLFVYTNFVENGYIGNIQVREDMSGIRSFEVTITWNK